MLVVCNGMMRSGSTLQYNLVCELMELTDTGQREGFFWKAQLESDHERLARWARDEKVHVIKSHWLSPRLLDEGLPVRICYTYRSLFDVAMSMKRIAKGAAITGREDDYIVQHLDEAVATYYRLKEELAVVWQRYEELAGDLPAATRTLAAAFHLPVTEAQVAEVAGRWTIDVAAQQTELLKQKASRKRQVLRLLQQLRLASLATRLLARVAPRFSWKTDTDRRTQLRPDHISEARGAAGTWRSGLEPAEKELLAARYRQWFLDAGYADDLAS